MSRPNTFGALSGPLISTKPPLTTPKSVEKLKYYILFYEF